MTELLGDGIGPELSRAVHTLAEALPVRLDFLPVDFSLENRRKRKGTIYDEAVESVKATTVALKYPTVTAEESPNAVLRRRLDLSVIHRPVYTIPGVPTNFLRELDLDIVRIATGGTYDDPGRAIGDDGAVSLRIVERRPVREAARYAFGLARKTGKRVTSASKYTIQKATDGLFEAVAKEVAGQHPEVTHTIELFDALLGKVIMTPDKFQIVLVLNEYGDFLSDMACGLAGSLGIGASANLAFDASAVVRVALFDAAHGTAPDIAGKNLANPTAIFLALSLLLYQVGEIAAGSALKTTTLDLLRQGGSDQGPGAGPSRPTASRRPWLRSLAKGYVRWHRKVAAHKLHFLIDRQGVHSAMDTRFHPAQARLVAGDVEGLASLLKADPGLAAARSQAKDHPTLLQCLVLTMPPVETLEDLIGLLADHGAELTDPLIAACGIDNGRAVIKLLDLGANIEGNGRWSPLEEALYFAHEAIVSLLLRRGAVVNNLRTAAGVGDLEKVARCFDEKGALTAAAGEIAWPFDNLSIPEELRRDPRQVLGNALVYAAAWGRIETANFLLKQGADVNLIPVGFDYSGTPLHYATLEGRRAMVDLLLSHGADPAARDTKIDKLAEDWAEHGKHGDIAEYLRLARRCS